MNHVECDHWWYKSLHGLVLSTIKNQFICKNISILDAGCGTGGLLEYLRAHRYNILEGFDISTKAVSFARSKQLNIKLKDLKTYKQKNSTYDVIISNDTMYFFELNDQKGILEEFYKSLNNNGIVILNLPSFNFFKGIHDEAVGIKNRFKKSMVYDMIDKSKYEIVKEVYWPFLLSPIIFIVRFLQRIRLIINKNQSIKSDLDLPIDFVNKALFKIVKLENYLFPSKPFGSSLFIVLRKIN
jgi:SAM-dependent methyltransferase